jgi:hypothetical protein
MVALFRCVRSRSVGRRGRWRPRVADSATVVVSQAVVAGLCRAQGAVVVAAGRAAWLPPPRRAIWPGGRGASAPDLRARGAQQWPQTRATLQNPRRRERLRQLRRISSLSCAGMRLGRREARTSAFFPPPLGGKLPSFGSRRPAGQFYTNSATFVQLSTPLRRKVAEVGPGGGFHACLRIKATK